MDDIILPLDPQSNLTPKTTFIYCLKDPRDNTVRYIGKSNDPERRLKGHISKAKHERTHKGHWIASLLALGLVPIMEIIEEVPVQDWHERETYHIRYYLEHSHPLTNTLIESRGNDITPLEVRAKISAAHKGRKKGPFSEEWRRKLGDVTRGKKQSPEHVEKRTASQIGRKHTDETRAKLSAMRKGKPLKPETKAKIAATQATPEYKEKHAAAHRGLKHTPEAKAKIAAAGRGRQVTPKTREKLAAANRGTKRSPETRAKISAAKKNTSPETRAKISASLTGKKLSPESIEKRSNAVRGRKRPPEVGAKVSAAKTGKKREPFSDEWKRNLGDAARGRKHTPEARAKMSEARKRWHSMKQDTSNNQ